MFSHMPSMEPTLRFLAGFLKSDSSGAIEACCRVLMNVVGALHENNFQEGVFHWFIESPAFSDAVVAVGRNPDAAASSAFLIFRISDHALLPVMAEYLREVCGPRRCHVAGVQAIMAELLRRPSPTYEEVQQALSAQGVYDYLFKLASENAKHEDCLQPCLQLLADLWQFYPGSLRDNVSSRIVELLRQAALHETKHGLGLRVFRPHLPSLAGVLPAPRQGEHAPHLPLPRARASAVPQRLGLEF